MQRCWPRHRRHAEGPAAPAVELRELPRLGMAWKGDRRRDRLRRCRRRMEHRALCWVCLAWCICAHRLKQYVWRRVRRLRRLRGWRRWRRWAYRRSVHDLRELATRDGGGSVREATTARNSARGGKACLAELLGEKLRSTASPSSSSWWATSSGGSARTAEVHHLAAGLHAEKERVGV